MSDLEWFNKDLQNFNYLIFGAGLLVDFNSYLHVLTKIVPKTSELYKLYSKGGNLEPEKIETRINRSKTLSEDEKKYKYLFDDFYYYKSLFIGIIVYSDKTNKYFEGVNIKRNLHPCAKIVKNNLVQKIDDKYSKYMEKFIKKLIQPANVITKDEAETIKLIAEHSYYVANKITKIDENKLARRTFESKPTSKNVLLSILQLSKLKVGDLKIPIIIKIFIKYLNDHLIGYRIDVNIYKDAKEPNKEISIEDYLIKLFTDTDTGKLPYGSSMNINTEPGLTKSFVNKQLKKLINLPLSEYDPRILLKYNTVEKLSTLLNSRTNIGLAPKETDGHIIHNDNKFLFKKEESDEESVKFTYKTNTYKLPLERKDGFFLAYYTVTEYVNIILILNLCEKIGLCDWFGHDPSYYKKLGKVIGVKLEKTTDGKLKNIDDRKLEKIAIANKTEIREKITIVNESRIQEALDNKNVFMLFMH